MNRNFIERVKKFGPKRVIQKCYMLDNHALKMNVGCHQNISDAPYLVLI